MVDYRDIYANKCDLYDQLVCREDYQNNLVSFLQEEIPLGGTLVEFGAGTGRMTEMLSPFFQRILAFDESPQMLEQAKANMSRSGVNHVVFGMADHRSVPVADESADVCLEGWAFGHLVGRHHPNWREEIDLALAEMMRVLKPGGTAVLIETMTTGSAEAKPPSKGLADLYSYWTQEHGFRQHTLRTDYRFRSPAEARELLNFFFGKSMSEGITEMGEVIFPECTGVWIKNV